MGKREKLFIQAVDKEKSGTSKNGPWTAVDCFAKPEGAEQAQKYSIFKKPELYPYIKEGQTIDCETTEKEREWTDKDGGVQKSLDRNIVQVYVDGKPVIEQKKGGWTPRQDNPEQRRSIERQTAVKTATELAIAALGGTIDLPSILTAAEQIYHWISEGDLPQEKPDKPQDTVQPVKTPQQPSATPESRGTGAVGTRIDIGWLQESIKKINWPPHIGNYLKEKYKVSGKSVAEMVSYLTKEQAQEFTQEIERRLKES